MDALIEQYPAAGYLALGAPIRLIEGTESCLSIHPAHIDDASKLAETQNLERILNGFMVPVIESIHEFLARMSALALDYPDNVVNASPGWLLAKHMEACIKSGDRHLGRHIIRQTDDQNVQVLRQQMPVITVIANAVRERALIVKRLVAHGHYAQTRMAHDAILATLSDNTEPGDADFQVIHCFAKLDSRNRDCLSLRLPDPD